MCPFRGAKAPPAVHFTGVSPRSGPFRWGPVYRLTGQLSGGGRKIFLPGSWLKILWPVHLTLDRWNGRGLRLPPGKSTAGNRPQEWRQEGGLLRHQAQFPHTPSGVQGAQVTARQGRRDRNGRCKPGFHASDRSGSPKPRQRVRRRLAGAPAAARRSRA
ncbi:hypothetical protein G962_04234 [Escherichia coli UMEA 3304-1]|nr:hypothetical protein G962_04243 [Escherichia coli UMEA 3304-1]EQY78880.1 hypothetical protein G962_04234 [Escherichia coli UMEA 3304-1]